MYKVLCTMLVAVASLAAAQTAQPTQPTIVAKAKLIHQSLPILETTIFTPDEDGLYRLSMYASVTRANPNSTSTWEVNLFWSDDAGPVSVDQFLDGSGNIAGPFLLDSFAFPNVGGPPAVFEAKAQSKISFSVTQGYDDNSEFLLYYVLERLE